jgi:hypothetical protein
MACIFSRKFTAVPQKNANANQLKHKEKTSPDPRCRFSRCYLPLLSPLLSGPTSESTVEPRDRLTEIESAKPRFAAPDRLE